MSKGVLERGHIKAELVRLLARGEHTQVELAERFEVTQAGISRFAKRNADAIQRVKDRVDDEFAALWIADKFARLSTYQQQVEDIADMLGDAGRLSMPTAELMRTAQSALKSVAEELGQLPNRHSLQLSGEISVRYVVDGVNPELLR